MTHLIENEAFPLPSLPANSHHTKRSLDGSERQHGLSVDREAPIASRIDEAQRPRLKRVRWLDEDGTHLTEAIQRPRCSRREGCRRLRSDASLREGLGSLRVLGVDSLASTGCILGVPEALTTPLARIVELVFLAARKVRRRTVILGRRSPEGPRPRHLRRRAARKRSESRPRCMKEPKFSWEGLELYEVRPSELLL